MQNAIMVNLLLLLQEATLYRFLKYIAKMCNKKLFQGHHRTLAVLANESESVLIKQLSNISILLIFLAQASGK